MLRNEILDAFKRITELDKIRNQEMDVVHRLMDKMMNKCINTNEGVQDGRMDHTELGGIGSRLVATGTTLEIDL